MKKSNAERKERKRLVVIEPDRQSKFKEILENSENSENLDTTPYHGVTNEELAKFHSGSGISLGYVDPTEPIVPPDNFSDLLYDWFESVAVSESKTFKNSKSSDWDTLLSREQFEKFIMACKYQPDNLKEIMEYVKKVKWDLKSLGSDINIK